MCVVKESWSPHSNPQSPHVHGLLSEECKVWWKRKKMDSLNWIRQCLQSNLLKKFNCLASSTCLAFSSCFKSTGWFSSEECMWSTTSRFLSSASLKAIVELVRLSLVGEWVEEWSWSSAVLFSACCWLHSCCWELCVNENYLNSISVRAKMITCSKIFETLVLFRAAVKLLPLNEVFREVFAKLWN